MAEKIYTGRRDGSKILRKTSVFVNGNRLEFPHEKESYRLPLVKGLDEIKQQYIPSLAVPYDWGNGISCFATKHLAYALLVDVLDGECNIPRAVIDEFEKNIILHLGDEWQLSDDDIWNFLAKLPLLKDNVYD